uniref:Ig-like domain-containing protein n=1 Tax=Poecilia mexicana TaxID=48701 RepID=A0A3B3XIJ7_9TELE
FISLLLLHGSAEPRYAPVFDRKLSPREVTVGDSIEMECHMTGSAPIKVTWSKDHKDIRSGGNYKISCVENTAHLTILKADKGDTGKYFCHASNDMGKDSCSTDISVKAVPLKFIKKLENIVLKEAESIGSSAVFECEVSPSTAVTSWMKDGGNLRESPKHKFISDGKDRKLHIIDVQLSDTGEYTCVAKNAGKEISCTAKLIVEGNPASFG